MQKGEFFVKLRVCEFVVQVTVHREEFL